MGTSHVRNERRNSSCFRHQIEVFSGQLSQAGSWLFDRYENVGMHVVAAAGAAIDEAC